MYKKYISLIIATLSCQICSINAACQIIRTSSGVLSDSYTVAGNSLIERCWEIFVPANHLIDVSVHFPEFGPKNEKYCINAFLSVKLQIADESEDVSEDGKKFCGHEVTGKQLSFKTTKNSFVEVLFHVESKKYADGTEFLFGLTYSQHSSTAFEEASEARKNAIGWLLNEHSHIWGWKENTARAVTALYLAGRANFSGLSLKEELMVKQTELNVAVSLLRTAIPAEELSMDIHALLVTCNNPRRFHGYDLIKRLKNQLQSAGNSTHPSTFLALCNANETWPSKTVKQISDILSNNSQLPFLRDIKAFAIMALSCMDNRNQLLSELGNENLKSVYQNVIKQFKEYQASDGSFGNVHTTALITQALLSAGEVNATDWKLNDAMKYMIKETNLPSVDFIATYLTLPVFNGKSLSDIADVNCSSNPRRHEDGDLALQVKEHLGPKIRVQYSLFIGNKKDVIHTTSLLVPENFTAFEVMRLAETQDYKYKFEWKRVSEQLYVYEIANVSNDPEAGKFWLTYIGSIDTNEDTEYTTLDVDELVLSDEDHLIMWYKTAHI